MLSINSSVLNNLKRSRIRFSEEDNQILLTEILANNPYADPSKWVIIHSNFCKFTLKILSVRGVKEHVQYIIKNFEKREKGNRARSGAEEPYNALDHLQQEVLDLINNILKEKDKLKEESKSLEKGKMFRDNFAQKFFERPSEQMGHGHECSGKPDNVANESTGFGENSTIEVLYEEDDQFVSKEPQIQHEPDIQEQSQNKHESEQPQIPHKEAQIEGPNRRRKRRAAKKNSKKTTFEYLEEKTVNKID